MPLPRELAPGDRVQVQFHTQGCYHDYRYQFDLEHRGTLVARSSAGRAVALSPAQAAGLDRLIRFYRERHEGFCSTHEEVTLTYFRRGRKITKERYSDGTCQSDDVKPITTFYQIGYLLGLVPQ